MTTTPQVGRYEMDTASSTIRFTIRHLFGLGVVRGGFAIRCGTVDIAEPATDSQVRVDIDPATVHTGNKHRDGNVRSPRFLDAEKYPTITFTSSRRHGSALEGTLTVQGIARPVGLAIARSTAVPGAFTARATTRIDRTEFGVTAQRGIVGRYLDLTLEIRCVQV